MINSVAGNAYVEWKPTEVKYFTDEVFSFPIVSPTVDSNIKSYVAFVLQERLYANRAVSVYHRAHHHFILEAALDFLALVETRSCDVNDGTAQHVSTFRGENQRQMGSGWIILRVRIMFYFVLIEAFLKSTALLPISLLQVPNIIFSSILKICRPGKPFAHPLLVKSRSVVAWE